MACGAPVISLNRGAARELIVNGKTGFVVNSIGEMVEAVGKIDTIKRRDCREHVAKKFAIDNMVDKYEKAFQKMLEKEAVIIEQRPGTLIKKGISRVRRSIRTITKDF